MSRGRSTSAHGAVHLMAAIALAAPLAACPSSHPPGWTCATLPCDDGDACNGVETCDPTRGCLPGPSSMACNDDDPCTVDSCVASACAHDPRDLDGDGHADACAGGDDCAPQDASIHPGAIEVCNDLDDDCDRDVDEGLPAVVLEEWEVAPASFTLPSLLLSDRIEISRSIQGLWAASDRAASHLLLSHRRVGWYPNWLDVEPGVLLVEDGGWIAMPWGPVSDVGPGRRYERRVTDEVAVMKVSPTGTLENVVELDPCSTDRCRPTSLSLANVAGRPTLAFAALHDGRPAIYSAAIGALEETLQPLTAVEGGAGEVVLLGGSQGGVVLWTDGGIWEGSLSRGVLRAAALRAAVLDPDGFSGVALDVALGVDGAFDACGSLGDGWLLVTADGTTELQALDATLVPEERASWPAEPVEPSIHCSDDGIWVLSGRWLRRFGRDGQQEVDQEIPGWDELDIPGQEPSTFVGADRVVIAGRRADGVTETRVYGCAP